MRKSITVDEVVSNINYKLECAMKDKKMLKEEIERETNQNNISQYKEYISDITLDIIQLRKDRLNFIRLYKRYEDKGEGYES